MVAAAVVMAVVITAVVLNRKSRLLLSTARPAGMLRSGRMTYRFILK